MSEDERARKFVERHFPVVAAFLAAERGGGPAPVYGPTGVQNDHDDQPEPWVTVRVDYRVSRWELLAALAAGYATANEMQDPDGMTVEEIRRDVESFLADTSARELDAMVEEVAGRVERGEDREQFEALRRAMDRAYPVAAARPVRVPGERTVTVRTLDAGDVVTVEPHWCIGEHADGEHRADLNHQGEEHPLFVPTACCGTVQVGTASLYQRPFAERSTRSVVVAVDFAGSHETDAEHLAGLADALVAYAVGPLHSLIERLQLLEGGQS